MTDIDTDALDRELQDLPNVIGAMGAGEKDRPVALVRRKVPEDQLAEEEIVANVASVDCDVLEVGDIKAESAPEEILFEPESSERYEPVVAGAEEQPDGKNWVGTGGIVCEVTDPSAGEWARDVRAGDLVRISNAHVYVGMDFATGRPINQPYEGREVGELVGWLPIVDGVRCDIAARTVTSEDGWGVAGLDPDGTGRFGEAVRQTISAELIGTVLTKSGRTTDVTEGQVRGIDATIRVRYSEGTRRLTGCVLTERMGAGGDSGSPRFAKDTGALVDVHFAGSDKVSVGFPMIHAIEDFGIEPVTDFDPDVPPVEYGSEPEEPAPEEPGPGEGGDTGNGSGGGGDGSGRGSGGGSDAPDTHEPEADLEDRIEALFVERYGRSAVARQFRFPETGWRVDLRVDQGAQDLVIECESRASEVRPGVAQALSYARHEPGLSPMIVAADEHLPEQSDLAVLRELCDIVTESELRARLDHSAIGQFLE